MTEMTKRPELTGTPKLLVEMGPLVAFLVGYMMAGRIGPVLDSLFGTQMFGTGGKGVFVATALFMPAFVIASCYSIWKERRFSPMLIMTGILVLGFGSLTLMFQSKIFYYMKSTFAYLLFAGVLGGGLLVGRNFLKMIMSGALQMPDHAWKTLTWRFFWLYLALAVGNEVLWRTMTPGCDPNIDCAAEDLYVKIETFGFMGLIFLFIIAQAPFITKHAIDADEPNTDGEKSMHTTNADIEAQSVSNSKDTTETEPSKDQTAGS